VSEALSVALELGISDRLTHGPRLIPPGYQPDFGKLIDLEMVLMPGGRERTADECASLFDRAGFELARIVPTQSPLSVVEARIAQRSQCPR
jgi:hypothetical protein